MTIAEIKAHAKAQGFIGVEQLKDYKGYSVFIGIISDGEQILSTGLPQYFLVKGDNIRYADLDETERLMARGD
jgi:hypothetical protein